MEFQQKEIAVTKRKKGESIICHVTPVGRNIFLDLGFEPEEAERLLAESDKEMQKELAVKRHGLTYITEQEMLDTLFTPNEQVYIREQAKLASLELTKVSEAIERMRSSKPFFTQEEWNDLGSHDEPVVSGDPEGLVPTDLEGDDNEADSQDG